jgi:hypothetical protein
MYQAWTYELVSWGQVQPELPGRQEYEVNVQVIVENLVEL